LFRPQDGQKTDLFAAMSTCQRNLVHWRWRVLHTVTVNNPVSAKALGDEQSVIGEFQNLFVPFIGDFAKIDQTHADGELLAGQVAIKNEGVFINFLPDFLHCLKKFLIRCFGQKQDKFIAAITA